MKRSINKIAVILLSIWPGLSGYTMFFSLIATPEAYASVNNYWEEPLAVASNTCILLPVNEGSGTTFYGQNTNSPYAFLGYFRSADSAVWTSAMYGSGLAFNGATNQGVNIQQNSALSLTKENATWEFWLKINQILTRDQVVSQVGSAWQIKVRPNGQLFCSANHGGTWKGVDTFASLATGVWTHVIFTRECLNVNGSYADYIYTVYTNGELSGIESFTNAAVPASGTADMTVGYSIWNTSHFNGVIDDFRISHGISRRQGLFQDNGAIFQNPHMGFAYATDPHKYLTYERYDNPENPPPEFQVIKLVVQWKDVEPSPGQYNWSETDQAIQLLRQKGFSINARFLLSNGKTNEIAVPAWLYQVPYNVGYIDVDNNCKDLPATRHPYYWDTNFQSRARNILSQFVSRYGSNDISWLDVRIYGHTGEWDSGNNPFPWEQFLSQSKSNVLSQLVDIYADEFEGSNIPVAINPVGWEYANSCQIPVYSNMPLQHCLDRLGLQHAFDCGFGIRLDDVRGWSGYQPTWVTAGVLALYGDSHFVVGETGNGWDPVTDPPSNVVNNALMLKMTSIAYGGYRSLGRIFVTNYPDAYNRGMKNIGYRLIPSAITYPSIIQTGQVFSIDAIWENHAVGRLIKDNYQLRAYLKDASGNIYWQRSDTAFNPTLIVNGNDFDPSNPNGWYEGGLQYPVHHNLSRIHVSTPPGTYDLYIAIVRDDNLIPAIHLPIAGDDGASRYRIGSVTVVN